MSITESFRGDERDSVVVRPVDPSRPHRFAEQAVGRVGTCYFCAMGPGHPLHQGDPRQVTVQYRDADEEREALRR